MAEPLTSVESPGREVVEEKERRDRISPPRGGVARDLRVIEVVSTDDSGKQSVRELHMLADLLTD
jgi:hypothetical protein